MDSLQSQIERLASTQQLGQDAREIFLKFRDALTRGEIRAAERQGSDWKVNAWVKQGILLGFRLGEMTQMGTGECLSLVDKDTFPPADLLLPTKCESCRADRPRDWVRILHRQSFACRQCSSTWARTLTKAP